MGRLHDPHRFGAWERNFLELLGGQVAIAIANAKTYEAAQRGHERLAAILNSSVDPIIVVDMRESIALLNPAAATALDVDTDQLIGSSLDVLEGVPDGETLIKLLRGEMETEGLEWASADNRAYAPMCMPCKMRAVARQARYLPYAILHAIKTCVKISRIYQHRQP